MSVPVKRPKVTYFPRAVLEEVVKALPVESLVRLRCVCKWWRSVIDDPHFVNLHRIESYQRPGGIKFLLGQEVVVDNGYREVEYKLVKLDEIPTRTLKMPEVEDRHLLYGVNLQRRWKLLKKPLRRTQPLTLPKLDRNATRVRPRTLKLTKKDGSLESGAQGVEGLLCNGCIVWNPTTGKRCHLPPHDCETETWALGFDSHTMEYKVVQILSDKKVQVLTVGTNAWRNVDTDHVPVLTSIGYGVYAQNKIFFKVEAVDDSRRLLGVLVFWVGEERFQFLAPPEEMDRSENSSTIECGNSIALMGRRQGLKQQNNVVWILCDVENQKWDRVIVKDCYNSSLARYIKSTVVCSIDNTDEVLVLNTCRTMKQQWDGRYSYWDIKKGTARDGPVHRLRIYSKLVETLFDPTLVRMPRPKEIFDRKGDVAITSNDFPTSTLPSISF